MAKPKGFQIYTDAGGGWRWRLIHPNGNVVADSSEAYASRQKALQGIRSVKGMAANAQVLDEAGMSILPSKAAPKKKPSVKTAAGRKVKKAKKAPAKKKA